MTSKPTHKTIPVELIDPDPDNGRADMSPAGLAELATSLKRYGMEQPIGVNKGAASGRFELIWGHRRLAAAKLAKIATVPARVYRGLSLDEKHDLRLVENLQREDLSPIDEANEIYKMLDRGLAVPAIGTRLDRSGAWVYGRLDLLRLSPEIATLVATRRLPAEHGRVVARLADRVEQLGAAAFAIGLRFSGGRLDTNGHYSATLPGKKNSARYGVVEWGAESDWTVALPKLRREVGEMLRKTSSLWPLDVQFAGEKPCIGCGDHSLTEPSLFAEIAVSDDGGADPGKCGNAVCYAKKLRQLEKDRAGRRKTREQKAKKKLKDQAAREKKSDDGVCVRCGKVKKEADTWPKPTQCPRCESTLAKEAERQAERDKRAAERSPHLSTAVAAKRKAFPATPADKFAVAMWKHAGDVCDSIVARLRAKKKQPREALPLLVLLRYRCSFPTDYRQIGKQISPAELLSALRKGKQLDVGPVWIADAFASTFKMAKQHAPAFGEYDSKPRQVPLDKAHCSFLDLVEAIARRWGLAIAERPKKPEPEKKPKKPAAKKPPGPTPAPADLCSLHPPKKKPAAKKPTPAQAAVAEADKATKQRAAKKKPAKKATTK